MTAGCLLLSVLVLIAAAIMRPSSARCPRGWFVNGVSARGGFACRRDADGVAGELRGAIYCTGGARAITADSMVVGCMHGGWP